LIQLQLHIQAATCLHFAINADLLETVGGLLALGLAPTVHHSTRQYTE